MGVYLDYNASAPIDSRVLDTMVDVYKHSYGNADSRTHDFGDEARKVVENARQQVAILLGISKNEVFFTSGATESNNIAILGMKSYAMQTGKKHIIVSAIEHKAILETSKKMASDGFDVDFVKPGLSGRVSVDEIISLVRDDTFLISIMHVNNETGIIQPVYEIGNFIKNKEIFFHIDATQSCGKLVREIQEINYDMLSFSAHKLSGPQGIGALVLRKRGYRLPPVKSIMYGGPQEHNIRPGTVPVALVAGLGKVCEIASSEYEMNMNKCKEIKNGIIEILNSSGIKYEINGDSDFCIPNTLNVCLYGVSSEALMLSSKQYCGISNGSACNSSEYSPSFVLKAMGIPIEKIENSIRLSWGSNIDKEKLLSEFTKMIEIAKSLAI